MGATYEVIAQQLGYAHRGKAYEDVAQWMAKVGRESARELLELELQRLDHMLMGLWNSARTGNEKAVTAALRIMERRARYLGLDFADGLYEREVTVAEKQAALLAGVIQATFDDPDLGLTAEQRRKAQREILPRHLRAVE